MNTYEVLITWLDGQTELTTTEAFDQHSALKTAKELFEADKRSYKDIVAICIKKGINIKQIAAMYSITYTGKTICLN